MGAGSGNGPLAGLGVNVLQNLIPHLQAWWTPIIHLGWLVGLFMVVFGTIVAGRMRANPAYANHVSIPVSMIVVGFVLINLVSTIDTLSWTLFQKTGPTGLSYIPPNPTSVESVYIQFAVYVIQLVGLYGLIRGFVGLKRTSNGMQSDSFWKSLGHVVGGTLAINIVTFAHYLGVSMGANVESVVVKILGPP